MAATVGRLRECTLLDWKFVVLSHNTIRGAAGAAVLNAEVLARAGKLDKLGVRAKAGEHLKAGEQLKAAAVTA
jgi:aspartate-semialdehyde dehydrogenase